MTEPFLFKFRRSCSTHHIPDPEVFYDDDSGMVVTKENNAYIPIIHSEFKDAPATKKADIEKGDDQKDSLMWA